MSYENLVNHLLKHPDFVFCGKNYLIDIYSTFCTFYQPLKQDEGYIHMYIHV